MAQVRPDHQYNFDPKVESVALVAILKCAIWATEKAKEDGLSIQEQHAPLHLTIAAEVSKPTVITNTHVIINVTLLGAFALQVVMNRTEQPAAVARCRNLVVGDAVQIRRAFVYILSSGKVIVRLRPSLFSALYLEGPSDPDEFLIIRLGANPEKLR